MTPDRPTPIYADASAPALAREARRSFRVAQMDLPALLLAYILGGSAHLFGDNLAHSGLNPLHWTRERLHFGDALFQGLWLTFILFSFDVALRFSPMRGKATR